MYPSTGLDYWTEILDWTEFLDKFLHLFLEEAYIFPDSYLATMDDCSNDNSCLLLSVHNLKVIHYSHLELFMCKLRLQQLVQHVCQFLTNFTSCMVEP